MVAAPIPTRRLREVAACIVEGLTNAEIAERLTVTPQTVNQHIYRLVRRMGARHCRHLYVLLGRMEQGR
jgi:DNA-binding CsgD family transcriptional regulator